MISELNCLGMAVAGTLCILTMVIVLVLGGLVILTILSFGQPFYKK